MSSRHTVDKKGSVITFYSYKGGVGRTMALANTACLLAKLGKSVLVIDWDLEAPGLHKFFKNEDTDQVGLIDLMIEVKKHVKIESRNKPSNYLEFLQKKFENYTVACPIKFKTDKEIYSIQMIKSGKFDSNYSEKINSFNWLDFYSKSPAFFRIFAHFLRTRYDFILIDSRTGFADTSGICTMLLPERLVLIFAPTNQNLQGVIDVAVQSRNYRINSFDDRTLALFPLPSRIDSNNTTQRPIWLNKYSQAFNEVFKESFSLNECNLKYYFEKASIRYIHDYAYGENIPVLFESLTDNKSISNDYYNFLSILIQDVPIWEIDDKVFNRLINSLNQIQSPYSNTIKIIGIGGGGNNAVNEMYNQGITGVDFIVCNTDQAALDSSIIPTKIQLGNKLLGSGSIPMVGKNAAIESSQELNKLLRNNTKIAILIAGFGGGTGTGATPEIAALAKNLGILTVAIVSLPFSFEGSKRSLQAQLGIRELIKNVDAYIILRNDSLRDLNGDLKLSEAFNFSDRLFTIAAKGIAEIVTVQGYISIDIKEIIKALRNSGLAKISYALGKGKNRAEDAVQNALSSLMIKDSSIEGAANVLVHIASGDTEITLEEIMTITDRIQHKAGSQANIIWGNNIDKSLGNNILVTFIATGFEYTELPNKRQLKLVIKKGIEPISNNNFKLDILSPKNNKSLSTFIKAWLEHNRDSYTKYNFAQDNNQLTIYLTSSEELSLALKSALVNLGYVVFGPAPLEFQNI